MHIPHSFVAESFEPARGEAADFDAVANCRPLRPRPVEAESETPAALRTTLSWFWNSNPDWADEQIAVADDYSELVGLLIESLGIEAGQRIVLSASEPDQRREAWRGAAPGGVEIADWRPVASGHLTLSDLEALLDERTRLVVLTKACPVSGALNEIIPFAQRLAGSGVALAVEASHFIAHGPFDIRNLRCDALIASGDELFGARGAALWARGLGKVSAARPDELASSDTIAVFARSLGYAERLGGIPREQIAPPSDRFGRRESMRTAMQCIRQEERVFSRLMLRGFATAPDISVIGESDPLRAALRTPSFTLLPDRLSANELGETLAEAGASVEVGDLGSRTTLEALGVDPTAGVVRASLAHYHTEADIKRFLDALRSVSRKSVA